MADSKMYNRFTEQDRVKVRSLKALCLKAVAKNLDALVTKCSDCAEPKLLWRFPYPDCYIASPEADMIMKELGGLGLLTNERLTLFSKKQVDLHSITLQNVLLTPLSASIFRDFTLYHITALNVTGININDFIRTFSESTIENLHTLKLINMKIEKKTKYPLIAALGQFQHLRHLNVSNTNLDNDYLYNLVKALRRLEYLDISRTKVTDISCLMELRNNLTSLIIHGLELENRQSSKVMLLTILDLKELRVLDISNGLWRTHHRFRAVDQLIESGRFPYLKYFDMSGNPFRLNVKDIETFVANNQNLKFLGVAHCVNYKAIERLFAKYSSIEIIGGMNETQLMKTLQYYGPHRKIFIFETLYFVSDLVHRGHYFSPTFFEFVMKFLEDELKNKCYVYSAGVWLACERIDRERSHDIATELIQRMLNYSLIVIEEHWMHKNKNPIHNSSDYYSDDDDSESNATSSTQEVENNSIYSDVDGDGDDASSAFDEDNDDFGDPDSDYSESDGASYEDSSGSEGDVRENDDASSSSDEDDDGSVGVDDDAEGDYSESNAALSFSDSGEYGANGNAEVDNMENDDTSFSNDDESRNSDYDAEGNDRESDDASFSDVDSRDPDLDAEDDDRESDDTSSTDDGDSSDSDDDNGESGNTSDAVFSANSGADDDFDDAHESGDESEDLIHDFDEINVCLKFLKTVFRIDRVEFDNIRICSAIFNILKHATTSKTRGNALSHLQDTFERMSESELVEIVTNSSYMCSLIKCATEIFLTKDCVDEWLAERNDDSLSYLHYFYKINRDDLDIIGTLQKIIANRHQVCENFIQCGGLEVCTLILEKVKSNEDLAETAMHLREILKNRKSNENLNA